MAKKQGTVEDQSERRTQRRIHVGLPMLVRGSDSAGRRFEDPTEVRNVSRTGASFSTTREISIGMDLEVVIPKLGLGRPSPDDFQTLARVVRVEPGAGEGERIVGVHFVGPRYNRVFITES
jgi:hypothetical protein